MKWTKSFVITLREEPKEAESKSHRLLLKAGFIRQLASGIYSYLPLGWKAMLKVCAIIREEMDRIGGQELLMPALAPREIWEASHRWQEFGDDMFRLKDRKNKDLALCPTHEEIITQLATKSIRSYRDLPQIWYQIQAKFRDEPRPRFGVIRARQFIMKDSYSFDVDEAGLDKNYSLHKDAYSRIFKRCGLDHFIVEASGGLMGEGESNEFMARVKGGENSVALCTSCSYLANVEVANSVSQNYSFPDQALRTVPTPNMKTVEEVSSFLSVKPEQLVKSMVFVNNDGLFMVLVRGDYEISEEKLRRVFGLEVRPANNDEVRQCFGADLGFIGPQNIEGLKVFADEGLKNARGMVTGANRNDHHVTGLNLERDTKIIEYINVKLVKDGDLCSVCNSRLKLEETLELGHLFKLGTKYSMSLKAKYLDNKGLEKSIVMGSYGIGIERIVACICEQFGDDNSMVWPMSITPFEAVLTTVNIKDSACREISQKLYESLLSNGVEVLWDDRDENPGVKFNDRDLIGIPIGITVGPKGVKNNRVDVIVRKTGEKFEVTWQDATKKVMDIKLQQLEDLKP